MSKPKPKNPRIRSLADLSVNNVSSSDGGVGGGTGSSDGHTTGGANRSRLTGQRAASAPDRKQHTSSSASVPSSQPGSGHMKICHIPTLPNADSAKAMLDRVYKEFEPIMKRRGYYTKIRSVSEMCCCFDGLDFDPFTKQRTKGRKCRVMSANVWGYNQTTRYGSNKSHTIHLRMRHPTDHGRLFCYEDIAGTMAHELTHCEIGPHNAAFQKLMDEILEEHMELQYRGGLTMNGFTAMNGGGSSSAGGTTMQFPGEGNALGRAGPGSSSAISNHPGHKLGGDAKFKNLLTPGEAACIAAEARRRSQMVQNRGNHWCQPCIITIDDDSDDENKKEEKGQKISSGAGQRKRLAGGEDERKPPANQQAQKRPATVHNRKNELTKSVSRGKKETIVDLTSDNTPALARKPTASIPPTKSSSEKATWACRQCTFDNQSIALACSMCYTERVL